jgi:toxin CptA
MLRVALTSSRWLAAALIVSHAAAAATLAPLDLPLWAKLGLALLIAASLAHALYRHAFLASRESCTALEVREADQAAVHTRARGWQDARILGTTYVSPVLTVVNLRLTGFVFAKHVVIVADNVDGETFRRLRVKLRWAYRAER